MVVGFDQERLRAWLGADRVDVIGSPESGGWSNDTVFLRVDGRRLVLRLGPSGPSMFPTYDLELQVKALRFAGESGIAVPAVLASERDVRVLGRAFFVMAHIDGRVPPDDNPPFTRTGFLFEAAPADQRGFCEHAIDAISGVHAVEPPDFLPIGPTLESHMDWCRGLCVWAGIDHPGVVDAHAQLTRTLPSDSDAPIGLLWGDARPANMVVSDTLAVVGLLDWELAGSGPGEIDVAWFLEMNRMRSVGMGIDPLPGFLTDDDTWRRWSSNVARPATNVQWHHRFAAYRVAVLLFLFLRSSIAAGQLPAGHRLTRDNLATRRLQELNG